MATTYTDDIGEERCDDCGDLADLCTCTCEECGDGYQECSCDEEESPR